MIRSLIRLLHTISDINGGQQFDDLISHLRDDVSKVQDPQAKALFETAAEVIQGLSKAFKHFEQNSVEAWKS